MEIAKLFNALPSAGSQGVIWGIMAIGVYITYRILDVADLTVDGSIATGGAVAAVLIIGGCNVWVAMVAAFLVGMLAGLATGIFHTFMGIPAILAGILTQLSLYSINLRILGGKANMAVSVNNYPLLVSARNARVLSLSNPIFILAALAVAVIALLYWFFGTERGCSLRATGANANMARAQGINTNADKVLGLMLSNGLVAFSGALLTQYQGFVDVGMGRGEKRTLRWGISNMERDMYREQLRTLGLGLEERMSSKVGLLSGGQRQALTLLMAALRTPKLLLLDEHTAALDPKTAAKVLELTEKIVAEQKLTAMMVTHNMKDAIAMGNRLIMMNAGRIVVDVRGEEKKKLTREDLMQLFEKAAGQEIENDRMLLS